MRAQLELFELSAVYPDAEEQLSYELQNSLFKLPMGFGYEVEFPQYYRNVLNNHYISSFPEIKKTLVRLMKINLALDRSGFGSVWLSGRNLPHTEPFLVSGN